MVDREQKIEQQKPLLQIVAKEGLSEPQVRTSMRRLINEDPTAVENCGKGVYKVKFSNEEAGKKLSALHMRPLEGLTRPLQVTLLEQPMEIVDLFDLLHAKLAAREKIDMYQAPWERGTREVKSVPKQEKKPPPREEQKPPPREEKKIQNEVPRHKVAKLIGPGGLNDFLRLIPPPERLIDFWISLIFPLISLIF